jgi:16S rRNA (guanine527-N7)-methyltransferase
VKGSVVSRETLERAVGQSVSRETYERIEAYAERLKRENEQQNLVSASTIEHLWERHILDSAQLARFEPASGASWVDIGSGAGLPGLIIACLVQGSVTLVEPRRLRAEFLTEAVDSLRLKATVERAKSENVSGRFDVITGRAVAPLDRFLGISHHLSHPGTIWVLPKGRNAKSELADARRNWQCEACLEASITDPESTILVLSGVHRRQKR